MLLLQDDTSPFLRTGSPDGMVRSAEETSSDTVSGVVFPSSVERECDRR